MTVIEFTRQLNTDYGMQRDWPQELEVDADTYANCVKHLILQKLFTYEYDDMGYNKGVALRSVPVMVGPKAGIFFKGVELLLKQDVNLNNT